MFELFGLVAGALFLVPVLIAVGMVIALLCGVGHIFGLVWELFWGVFGAIFGLLLVFGLVAAGMAFTFFAVVF